ncbi:acyltransferase [Asticcacaulis sp. ZE23SCel15]|uniref:acyltransferase family protein n=1 Tax=Asticcacaulis sp. ZE23SCel15 TaxID=3059027 RepID=UPI00265FEA76|nr:acyltransferase [Asticcacaulis sp. ZE23SCel15]WKL55804.1 acyltransferase [Asticcacaulis sp. ZE23SCel15]
MTMPATPEIPGPEPVARKGAASLDVLRFLAAGFILLYHFGQNAPILLPEMSPLFDQGWLATDFFLILSGFVLSRAYGARLAAGRIATGPFMLRRIGRLWPSHMVVLLLLAALIVGGAALGFPPNHPEKYSVIDFVSQVFMVHGWGGFEEPGWNVPTWTLSALIVCYALFALYARHVQAMSRAGLVALLTVVMVVAFAGAHAVDHAFADLPFRFALMRAVPLFVVGTLIERLLAPVSIGKAAFFAGLAAAVLAIVMLETQGRGLISDVIGLSLLAAIISLGGAVTLRGNHLTHQMGRASFSLFLTHSLVGAVWFALIPKVTDRFELSVTAQWAVWVSGIVTAIVVAFVFEAVVDRPLSQWVQKRLSSGSGTGR